MSTPVFIVAQQRSGTNLLRRSLATTGVFRDSNEIFDPKTKSYWPWHVNQIRQTPELAFPTFENRLTLFEQFLESHLKSSTPFTLIDVKYNSTHLLDGLWHAPVSTPEFVQWLNRNNHHVIHLIRNNCLENYVSMAAGNLTGQWVVRNASEPADLVRLQLDPDETVFQVKRREREIRRFRNILASNNLLELTYESLIDDDGRFSNSVADRIFEFVGKKRTVSVSVPIQKTGRPVNEIVRNFESEIVPSLRKQGLESYAAYRTTGVTTTDPMKDPDATEGFAATIGPRPPLSYVPRIQRTTPPSRPVFVIAMQRSGTNLFRKSLASCESFDDLNEIFDPYQQMYWPYRKQQIAEEPERSVPTARNQLEIFESFLDRTLTSKKPFTFIDVKYNSTQHLNDIWYHPGARPLLFDWLIEQKCPVIHLVRENVFENYVSNVVAHQTQVWLVEKSAPIAECTIQLDVANTLKSIQTFKSQIDIFRTWLEPTNHVELTYESLIESQGEFSKEVINKTCELVGIDDTPEVRIPTRKTGRTLSKMVENFDTEIAPALIANGYASWIKQYAA